MSNWVKEGQKWFLDRCGGGVSVKFKWHGLKIKMQEGFSHNFALLNYWLLLWEYKKRRTLVSPENWNLMSFTSFSSSSSSSSGAVHYSVRGPRPDLGPPSADSVPLGCLLFFCSQNRPDYSGGMTEQTGLHSVFTSNSNKTGIFPHQMWFRRSV